MRGAVRRIVMLSFRNEPVGSPIIITPDVLISMNKPIFGKV